ncbi:peptidase [Bosea caraganae]|uniref:Peptidase n=1 Tax=Bosea caraganae TaxID=2763117 RepID=A0A370L928_9HYPH|nr:prepilin peptidase [Bosea caraganae]RDJ26879.1 peptidase [Bosea caraganae]RDJ30767.1 peptidase [Bosea caraganae]
MSLSLIILLVVFPAAMAYAAASDLVSMTISNWLCLALVAVFALCAVLLGLSWSEIGGHFAAGGLVLLICFGFFAAGWIGGGDAKFAAATALWFGFGQLMPYLLVASAFGGVLTVLILRLRAYPLPAIVESWPWARRLHSVKEGVPYGIALALSALFILPETAIWRAAIGI